jgi:hypothetical protein
MATFYKAPTVNYKQTTLNGAIGSGDLTITLNSTTNIQYPGYVVIDRQDASGNNTPTAREVVSFTGIAGNNLTGCTRGADNSSALGHNNGALVETMMTVGAWNSLVNGVATFTDANGLLSAIISPVSIAYGNFNQIAVSSVASIAQLRTPNAFIGNATVTGTISASGASVVGFGGTGTGGFNGILQVAGGLASLANAGGLVPIPTAFTGQFIQLMAQTPASAASIYVTLNKNFATYGVVGLLAQATFASSASIATPALAAGDVLTMDVLVAGATTSRYTGSDLTLLLRAI